MELEAITRQHDLDLIYLLAPTSDEERIALVTARSEGFVYLVSLTGVTGSEAGLPEELEDFVRRVRRSTMKPLCVGFGIAAPSQARRAAAVADGVIVGSKILRLIEEDPSLGAATAFVRELRRALDER